MSGNESRLKKLRARYDLSLRDLGSKTGQSYSALSRLERNQRAGNMETYRCLASFFGVTTDFLIGKDDRGIKVIYDYDKKHPFGGIIDEKELDRLTGTKDLEEVVTNAGIERYVTGKTAFDKFVQTGGGKIDFEQAEEMMNRIDECTCITSSSKKTTLTDGELEMLNMIRGLLPNQFDIIMKLIEELYSLDGNGKGKGKAEEKKDGKG